MPILGAEPPTRAPPASSNSPSRVGLFEQAHTGTLLLDEVGDMPIETQGKIVRALQEQTFLRIGGKEKIKVDVRVVATTTRDLVDDIAKGNFREDLYYRLNVVPLEVPNLAQRRDDIPYLAEYFMQQSAQLSGLAPRKIGTDAMASLQAYAWPGNVRQLENTCRWLTVMSPTREVKLEDLPDDLKIENVENLNDWTRVLQAWSENYLAKGNNNLLEEAIPEFERTIIKVALNKTMGRKKEAAELLGWGRNTLTRKIKELGLDN